MILQETEIEAILKDVSEPCAQQVLDWAVETKVNWRIFEMVLDGRLKPLVREGRVDFVPCSEAEGFHA